MARSTTKAKTGPDLAEAAEDWLESKQVGRITGDTGHADRARRNDLRRWALAIHEAHGRTVDAESVGLEPLRTVHVNELGSVETLTRALNQLTTELAATSCQRMISTLRGFTGWLQRRAIITEDVTAELHVKVRERTEVEAFTPEQINRLIHAAYEPGDTQRSPWPTRDAAIVSILAGCGLRVSELCALSFSSLDRSTTQPVFRIRDGAKGGKSRIVPIPTPTLRLLDAYLLERLIHKVGPKEKLFIRHSTSPLNQQFIDGMLRRLAHTAHIAPPTGAMAHALRHTYGSQLALRNLPLAVLQQLLGHADPRTTAIYTKTTANELTNALNNVGWLNE